MKSRAPRFPIQTPLHYRESGRQGWSDGTTVNISFTGVLFRAAKPLDPKTMIEMRILIPAEITGKGPANVVCWGPVVRTVPAGPDDRRPALAASILDYRLTHNL